jgi:hypothetical protein
MHETTITITEAITNLIEAGGPTALWGLLIYQGLALLATIIKTGAVLWILSVLSLRGLEAYKLHLSRRQERIHLVSEEVSQDLRSCIASLSKETSSLLNSVSSKLETSIDKLNGLLEGVEASNARYESERSEPELPSLRDL